MGALKKVFLNYGEAPKTVNRYQAAKVARLEEASFSWWGQDVNSLIWRDNRIVRERARNLVRNFPPFMRAIEAQLSFVIGKGGRFESLAVKRDGRNKDERLRDAIEARFRAWMENVTTDRRHSFYDCQRMALRQRLETGEFFCQLCQTKDRQLSLRFIEPDNVDGPANVSVTKLKKNEYVYQGIKFDRNTGERVAYMVVPYDPLNLRPAPIEIPVKHMLHGFVQVRPDQLRGVTPFASAIILADCLYDYTEAELDSAKMSSKWLAFVESPSPDTMQGNLGTKKKTDQQAPIEDLENGIIEYLRPGEKMTLASAPSRVTETFDRFVKYVLRMTGLTIGVPYEIMSGDYQGINYSTSRMSRQDYNKMLDHDREWLDATFNRPIYREWLKLEALREPKIFRDYAENPWRYEPANWIPSGMPSPDPLKEWKAEIDGVNSGLLSPKTVMMGRGEDPEKVLEDIKWFQDQIKEMGITLKDVSTAAANNPAAVAEQSSDKGDGEDENADQA
jgi:lambda family phage portal protein